MRFRVYERQSMYRVLHLQSWIIFVAFLHYRAVGESNWMFSSTYYPAVRNCWQKDGTEETLSKLLFELFNFTNNISVVLFMFAVFFALSFSCSLPRFFIEKSHKIWLADEYFKRATCIAYINTQYIHTKNTENETHTDKPSNATKYEIMVFLKADFYYKYCKHLLLWPAKCS